MDQEIRNFAEEFVNKQIAAKRSFQNMLKEQYGFSADQAFKITELLHKKNLVEIDGIGQCKVIHGALLNTEPLNEALRIAEEGKMYGAKKKVMEAAINSNSRE